METRYKIVAFDLDGTLTDSKEGITKSIEYALRQLNMKVPDADELIPFIGPPLVESFRRFCNFDDDTANRAVELYREYFRNHGLYENRLFPGISELLSDLRDSGVSLALATSKPTHFANQILNHFKIDKYFQWVVGSNLDNTRSSKTEILKDVLKHFSGNPLKDFVMVGDRKYDVNGAKSVGIDCIAVTYGFGTYEELFQAQPTSVANSITEVRSLLFKE